MPTYVYKGISPKHREFMLAAHMKMIKPQDRRAQVPLYYIDQKDPDEAKEQKRARVKKWHETNNATYAKELDGMDAMVLMKDSLGKPWEFPKGKSVEVPEDSSLVAKLNSLCASVGPFPQWEKVEKKAEPPKGDGKDTKPPKGDKPKE